MDYRRVSEILARFSSTLHDRYSLPTVLNDLSKELGVLTGADGAGVMLLAEDEAFRFVTAGDLVLNELEHLQLELEEGPCLLAYQQGTEVLSGDLQHDRRFPRFGPRAVSAGMAAVYSFPMAAQGETIGATNLYRRHPGQLDDEELVVARMLTDAASAFVVHAVSDDRSTRLNEQLQHALDSRIVIEQAKGMLAVMFDCAPGETFEVLRSYARGRNEKLRSVAERVVARQLGPRELRG